MKDIISLGPWGNKHLRNWSFRFFEGQTLKGLKIRHGEVVDGITFITADQSSNLITSEKTVGVIGAHCDEVELDVTYGEYITQISGTFADYHGVCCISLLRIHTNINQNGYGPYGLGSEEGKYGMKNVSVFSTPKLFNNAIVGFHGGTNRHLESLGLFLNPAPAKFGPWGHMHDWCFMFENHILKGMKIRHGSVIDAISFMVADKNSMTWENTYGGRGGRIDEIVLDTKKNEYLTQISGFIGNYAYDNDVRRISSLSFYTNLKLDGYGPYGLGRDEGKHRVKNVSFFSTPLVSHNAIVGFHGTASRYLESSESTQLKSINPHI